MTLTIDTVLFGVIAVLSVGVVLTFGRLVAGPNLPNRVVASDLMVTLGIGIVAIYATVTDQAVFLDVATILALITFLGTVAFAFFLERKASSRSDV